MIANSFGNIVNIGVFFAGSVSMLVLIFGGVFLYSVFQKS